MYKKTGRLFSYIMFLILFCGSFYATQVIAQSSNGKSYGLDRSTIRQNELVVGFQVLYGELTHGSLNSLEETDLVLIEQAIHYAPYYQDSIELMKTACEYYNSAEEIYLEVDYLVDLLAESARAEYEGKEAFLEASYQALSTSAKEKFGSGIRRNVSNIANMKSVSFDIEKLVQENSRDTTLEHISGVCERLPLAIKAFPSSGEI